MNSAKMKLDAKQVLNKNFKPLVLATAILMAVEVVCYFIGSITHKDWLSTVLLLIAEALILPGYIKMILNAARGKEVKIEDLTSETALFPKYIGLVILVGIVMGIFALLAAIDFKSLISIMFYHSEISTALAIFLIAFGLLLAASIIILTVYLAISLSQVLFILVDRKELSIKEILSESFDMMETFMLEYFILCLTFIGWIILGMITCGLLFIWITPYILVTFAFFYDIVKKDYEDFLKKQDKKEIKVEEPKKEVKPVVKKAAAVKKTPAKKAAPKKAVAKKTASKPKEASAKKAAPVKKTTGAKKTTTTKKATTTKKITTSKKTATAKKTTTKKAPAKKTTTKKTTK